MNRNGMTLYIVTMTKPAAILHGGGMIEGVVAHATANVGKVSVFVENANVEKFEKLIDADPMVSEYSAHPCNPLEGN